MTGEKDNLDNLIDQALTSYTSRAARPGLEKRILAVVAAEGSPRAHVRSWKPVWAFAAVLLLLTAGSIPLWIRPGPLQVTVARRAPAGRVEYSPQAKPALGSSMKRPLHRVSRRASAAVSLPLPTQFGQPRPTKEELLMARFAAEEPELADVLAKSKPDLDAPVTITAIPDNPVATEPVEMKPITIAPIQISSLN
jgi:hypothetical protein